MNEQIMHVPSASNLRKYRMQLSQWIALAEEQEWRCAICGEIPRRHNQGQLMTDHNHKTRLVRGLLCQRCNLRLAHYELLTDTWVKAAQEYLKEKE